MRYVLQIRRSRIKSKLLESQHWIVGGNYLPFVVRPYWRLRQHEFFGSKETPMSTSLESKVTPRDAARILFRHWRKIALVFCGVMALMLLAIAFFPRSYVSESKLMIRIGRESVALDPTATTGETIMLQKTQEDEVNSALNILSSREMFERVVEQVGADRIVEDAPADHSGKSTASAKSFGGIATWIRGVLVALRLSDPGTPMDQAVRRLEKQMDTSAPKQSMVITVTYKAASPQLAHDVVEAMTNVFLEEHSQLSQSEGSLKFFSEQTEKLFNDLTAAQQQLRDRKNAYHLTSADSRRSILERSQDAMRQKVYDLELQENDLLSRYTDEYPPLKEIRRQRELAESMLTSVPDNGEPVTASTDESTGGAGTERVPTKASPAVLQVSQAASVQKSKLKDELHTLNDQEFELAQLEREVKLLEGKYAMHVEKLEQARVNDALSREKITNVKIAQPASLVYKPVSPRKDLLLAGAFMLALIGGFGSALVAENLDQTLRTTDQVERQLGLPVLASLPKRKAGKKIRRSMATSMSSASVVENDSSTSSFNRHGHYRGLVAALRSAGSNESPQAKSIGVVGCQASKARSYVAGDLALEAAATGTDAVLLIDADTRHRRVSKRFHLNGSPGWREVLSGNAAVANCVQQSKSSNLSVMGPGRTNGDVTGMSVVDSFSQLDGIKNDYGLVVVDLPPAGEAAGSQSAIEWIDEAVLVVEAERTRAQAAQRAMDMLSRSGVQVIGVVLANRRDYIPRWLYQRL